MLVFSRLVTLGALTLTFAGCLPALPTVEPDPEPAFDPIAFFEGRTEGLGVLSIRARTPVVVRVESVGTPIDDGLELRQTIRLGDDPATTRTWVLKRTGPKTFTGSLTDAEGPVEATAKGNTLRIRYRMGRVTTVAQDLTLQPGGGLALNLMTVRVLGVPVARLTEQIRRVASDASDP
ncbi:DUF3833 family protein [Rubrivirga marina]|uniref:DUF3833 domain-containing protein n=1 Tax=Rubrivirga marina TaxID=1196024 RepID=A0A271J6X9_9BACT|nr:DUF3833 family protein [Rubrivirga marina]PAP78804.1 hypothetical protein BSZ37_15745 [Rubrivirga marina]